MAGWLDPGLLGRADRDWAPHLRDIEDFDGFRRWAFCLLLDYIEEEHITAGFELLDELKALWKRKKEKKDELGKEDAHP